MSGAQISVLMTCHNRREKTMACLRSLAAQVGRGTTFDLRIVLVDAGSSDGTAEAVAAAHPDVLVIPSHDGIFWGGGTAEAARHAAPGADHHLWLNDDVVLEGDALETLLRVAEEGDRPAIVVGQLRDGAGRPSYGGLRRDRWPLRMVPMGVVSRPTRCTTMNGNVVLVPREIVAILGPVDHRFPHAMGDIDYGLRASAAGVPVVQAPGVVGVCDRNTSSTPARWPVTRLRRVASVKELPPRAWWSLCLRHGGRWSLVLFAKPYVDAVLPRRLGAAAGVETAPGRRPSASGAGLRR